MNEPRCPYCGRKMMATYDAPEDHYYRCLYCKGVKSPARTTPKEAWEAAMRHTERIEQLEAKVARRDALLGVMGVRIQEDERDGTGT